MRGDQLAQVAVRLESAFATASRRKCIYNALEGLCFAHPTFQLSFPHGNL